MWAKITDGKIEEVIAYPKTIIINDVKHPPSIFTSWSWAELNSIGIFQVEDTATRGDARFQKTSGPTYTYKASEKKVVTSYTITDLSLVDYDLVDSDGNVLKDPNGNKINVEGLKTIAKREANGKANALISRLRWLTERVTMDSSKTIPTAVTTYCAAIRTDADNIVKAIDAASDMDAFKALYENKIDSDGKITEIARVNRWTDDSTVEEYIR
jgi:hypothetical protein